ncbi:MAG: cysteine--tRNA ligase [Limnochordales bacterium]|nr:cysteine--tRNA ligase [Limnochordales bacterium]
MGDRSESLRVTNTLTRQKEVFIPRDEGRVSIYTCGVTPYDESHLGHARPAVFFDVVRRYLASRGWQVRYVQNFTDVDDKIIARAQREGIPALEISRRYADEYLAAMDALGVRRADVYPKVSEHIPVIIEMVARLVEKGHAYVSGGDVYFAVESFPGYGKLSGQRLEEMMAGARVEVGEGKRHPADFALWKAARPGEPSWQSPWGPGRPGWHIECSAMSLHYLGNHFDIHGGGLDLVFPHHENEIAQSEAYTGDAPFVRYWLHNGLVTTRAEKMSKSLGNFITVRALLKEYPAEFIRYLLLSVHYRSPLEFGADALAAARRGWERLLLGWQELNRRLETVMPSLPQATGAATGPGIGATSPLAGVVRQTRENFRRAMDDDWNTPVAISTLFELTRSVNSLLHSGAELAGDTLTALAAARDLMRELGVELLGILPADPHRAFGASAAGGTDDTAITTRLIELLLEVREDARRRRDFVQADRIRDALGACGIVVEDTPAGPRWRFRGD